MGERDVGVGRFGMIVVTQGKASGVN